MTKKLSYATFTAMASFESFSFESFNTIGPSGEHRADINGRGAAIECYLDVGLPLVAERAKSFGEMKEVALAGGNLMSRAFFMPSIYRAAKREALLRYMSGARILSPGPRLSFWCNGRITSQST